MRTTLDLDADLLERALKETVAPSKTAVIEMGLQALLEREARKRLKALFGEGLRLAPALRALVRQVLVGTLAAGRLFAGGGRYALLFLGVGESPPFRKTQRLSATAS